MSQQALFTRNVPVALFVALGSCVAQSSRPAWAVQEVKTQAKAKVASKDPHADDRAGLKAAMQSFVKDFESGDAKAFAAHWTVEGQYTNEGGVTIQGREALERAFAEFFKKSPKVHAELAPKSLQFVSRDNAIEEGIVTVRSESSLAGRDARYKALFVREDGRWKLAVLDESPSDEVSMRNLDWLVGEWTSKGQDQAADITTTYSWNAGKKFLEVRFTIKEKNLPLSGMQVIGIDPATGQIHSWTFEAGGGIGEADWSRDGDHWVLNAEGTLADGRTLTETNILRRVNQDTFTWQSINRMLDGAELADLPPVKVTRVKSK